MTKTINLWVDDIRDPADYTQLPFTDWVWVKTIDEAIAYLDRGEVRVLFLDHDLGSMFNSAYEIVKWMAEWLPEREWPEFFYVHSANPVGAKNMLALADRYGGYTRQTNDGRGRFVADFVAIPPKD